MPSTPTSYAAYIARFPAAQRALAAKLRKAVLAAAPSLTECISYGLPAFAADGKAVLAIGAAKAHCALYPMSGRTLAAVAPLLGSFSTSRGTIRFELEKPLPLALIRKIVRLRLKEHQAKLVEQSETKARAKRPRQSATPTPAQSPASHKRRTPNAVNELLATLHLPHVAAVNAARRTILAADHRIIEAIKWNAPSFRIEEFFATIHLRAPTGCIQIVLHRGAKSAPRKRHAAPLTTPDATACTLRWPDPQRCILTLPLSETGRLKPTSRTALGVLVKEWIAAV